MRRFPGFIHGSNSGDRSGGDARRARTWSLRSRASAGGRGGPAGSLQLVRRSGFTLIELVVVIGIVGVLVALTSVGISQVRSRARDAQCASNLGQIGKLIHAWLNEHKDQAAPVLWGEDTNWKFGPQRGWDLEVGRWGQVEGGDGSMFECPTQGTPYIGNARALGVDRTGIGGQVHLVGPKWWHEPSRLVLSFDAQRNHEELAEHGLAPAGVPDVADLSNESWGGWGVHLAGSHRPFFMNLFGDI